MRRLILSLMPVNLMHEFGTGRALDNTRRELDQVAQTMAVIDALASRLESAALAAVAEAVVTELAAA